jgi:hypothetical protein
VALRNAAGPAQHDDAGEARKVTHADGELSRPTQNQAQEAANEAAARDFINLLRSRTNHDLWIQALPNEKDAGGGSCIRTRDVERIVEFCEKHDVPGFGVYYCVSSIDGARRRIETVAETPIIWFDIDFKDIKVSPAQALEAVKKLKVPPTRIHMSGNGIHGIYVLAEPWKETKEYGLRWTLRRLADVVGGDRKVCHAAQLMRMPGTHNSKHGAKKLVTVLTTATGVVTGASVRD